MGIKNRFFVECRNWTNRVGFSRSLRNILRTLCVYNRKKVFRALKTPRDFIRKGQELLPKTEGSPIQKASSLWFLERLAREARRFDNAAFLLKEKTLERFKPILHVGWAMDCLADTGFDYSRFTKCIAEAADPRYRLLALEPVGVIFVACRHPIRPSLIGIKIPPEPDEKTFLDFFSCFEKEESQVISHGYGRGTYFRSLSLCSALKRTLDCPACFNAYNALRGLAFAYTMVNCSELDRVFLTAARLRPDNLQKEEIRYFREGIVSALSFLEWSFPGVLASVKDISFAQEAKQALDSHRSAGGIYSL